MEISAFLVTMLMAATMVLVTVWIHYEALLLISAGLSKFDFKGRVQVLAVVIGLFFVHTVEIWLFAVCYYFMIDFLSYGAIDGVTEGQDFFEYLYFSTVSYTSLGLGEIYPTSFVRFISGAQSLIGLVMIGWSASFTYLMMEKFWKFKK